MAEYRSLPLTNGEIPVSAVPSVPVADLPASIPGVVYAARGTLAYTDTVAKTLFTLPAGAVIVSEVYNVTTAFDDTGTDQVNVGVSGTANKFASALDVSSAGLKTGVAGQIGIVQGGAQTVQGIYAGQNSNAGAGAMSIVFLYYVP